MLSMVLCDLCLSPYRSDIERSLRNNERKITLVRRYMTKFNVTLEDTFRKKLQRHEAHMDRTSKLPVIIEGNPGIPTTRVTMEKFAQRLLEIGSLRIAQHPEEVTIPDVIQAQRLLVERSKVKVQEDSLRLAVAKMFGGVGAGPTEPITAVEENEAGGTDGIRQITA